MEAGTKTKTKKRTKNEVKIGKWVELCRVQMNPPQTQAQAAKGLGIERGTLANIERDNRKPSLDLLIEMAAYFNTSSDFILGIQSRPLPLGAKEVTNYMAEMSPRGNAELVTVAKSIHKLDLEFQAYELSEAMAVSSEGEDRIVRLKMELARLTDEYGSIDAALEHLDSIESLESPDRDLVEN